jgi:hypothetical protein
MRARVLAALLAIGCGDDPPAVDAGTDAGESRDAIAGEDAATDEDGSIVDTGLPPGPGLAGVVRTEDDAPLGPVMVLACLATTCYFGESASDGSFYFMIEPPAEIALKTLEDLDTTPRRGASLAPVLLTDNNLVNVGSIYVPNLPAGTPFGPASQDPQTLIAGDGLELTLNRGDLRPRLGDLLGDLAARAIPEAHLPAIPELGAEQIVAVYALHPFGAHSSSPISVRATSTLEAGTPVRFRSISEIDGRLSEPADGSADGTFVTTNPGAGITELSWLVISR